MLNSLTAVTPGRRCAVQLFNARPIGSALFNPLLVRGSQPVAVARTEKLRSTDSAAPRADSHCPALPLDCSSDHAETGLVCACTHYLVFKEPTCRSTLGASLPCSLFRVALSSIFQFYAALSSLSTLFSSLTFEFFLRTPEAISASLRGTFQDYYQAAYSSTVFCFDVELSFEARCRTGVA